MSVWPWRRGERKEVQDAVAALDSAAARFRRLAERALENAHGFAEQLESEVTGERHLPDDSADHRADR